MIASLTERLRAKEADCDVLEKEVEQLKEASARESVRTKQEESRLHRRIQELEDQRDELLHSARLAQEDLAALQETHHSVEGDAQALAVRLRELEESSSRLLLPAEQVEDAGPSPEFLVPPGRRLRRPPRKAATITMEALGFTAVSAWAVALLVVLPLFLVYRASWMRTTVVSLSFAGMLLFLAGSGILVCTRPQRLRCVMDGHRTRRRLVWPVQTGSTFKADYELSSPRLVGSLDVNFRLVPTTRRQAWPALSMEGKCLEWRLVDPDTEDAVLEGHLYPGKLFNMAAVTDWQIHGDGPRVLSRLQLQAAVRDSDYPDWEPELPRFSKAWRTPRTWSFQVLERIGAYGPRP